MRCYRIRRRRHQRFAVAAVACVHHRFVRAKSSGPREQMCFFYVAGVDVGVYCGRRSVSIVAGLEETAAVPSLLLMMRMQTSCPRQARAPKTQLRPTGCRGVAFLPPCCLLVKRHEVVNGVGCRRRFDRCRKRPDAAFVVVIATAVIAIIVHQQAAPAICAAPHSALSMSGFCSDHRQR